MCEYCGRDFGDGDRVVPVPGGQAHYDCRLHAEALEATAGDYTAEYGDERWT